MELRQQESLIKSAQSRGALPLWRVPRPSAAGRGESGAETGSGLRICRGFVFFWMLYLDETRLCLSFFVCFVHGNDMKVFMFIDLFQLQLLG